MAKYLIAAGIDYQEKRAEIGDVVDDLPENAIEDLLAIGAIVSVEDNPKGKG